MQSRSAAETLVPLPGFTVITKRRNYSRQITQSAVSDRAALLGQHAKVNAGSSFVNNLSEHASGVDMNHMVGEFHNNFVRQSCETA